MQRSTLPTIERLRALLVELDDLPARSTRRWYWRGDALVELHWGLGAEHPLVRRFAQIRWAPPEVLVPGQAPSVSMQTRRDATFVRARTQANAVLVAAIDELAPPTRWVRFRRRCRRL